MNLYFRLLRVLFASLWRSSCHPRDEVASGFRVWPQDLDVFGHMNNGRYLQVMDVARVDWMRRTRILDRLWAYRCSALLGGTVIRYCKSLGAFERYSIHTSLIG